jgi:ubiquinone/menaquinone biosynthesis C-methylase UbiE
LLKSRLSRKILSAFTSWFPSLSAVAAVFPRDFPMTTDYNQIAEQYRQAKEQPWRHAIEEYSFMQLIGDLSGQKVVDLACGAGFFTRKLKQRTGAAQVVGTDISQEMIALARQQESLDPLGIEFRVEDARASGPQLDFDTVVTAWLLVYAHDREELAVMCRGMARQLRLGGRLVTLMTNPAVYHFPRLAYRPYGFDLRVEQRAYEGAPITWTIYLDDSSSFEIENYYFPIAAYQQALEQAGFREVKFHPMQLSPDAAAADRDGHWNEFITHPPAVMIDAIKC